MSVTGLPPAEAETRINRYLYEFEGSPEVTEGGAIYYSFPSLMRRKDRADRSFGGSAPMRPIAAFSANPKKSNIWFGVINAVNFLFGSYFAAESASHHSLLPTLYSGQYASHLVMTHGGDAFYLFVHQLLGKLGRHRPIRRPCIGYALGAVPSGLFHFLLRDSGDPLGTPGRPQRARPRGEPAQSRLSRRSGLAGGRAARRHRSGRGCGQAQESPRSGAHRDRAARPGPAPIPRPTAATSSPSWPGRRPRPRPSALPSIPPSSSSAAPYSTATLESPRAPDGPPTKVKAPWSAASSVLSDTECVSPIHRPPCGSGLPTIKSYAI